MSTSAIETDGKFIRVPATSFVRCCLKEPAHETKDLGLKLFLEDAKIDAAAERITEYLTELGLERKEVMRLRLSVENILLAWQTRLK